MQAEPAPGPDDINWEGLWAGWGERARRAWCVVPPLALLILFPIGPLTGALTNLPLAVCGGSQDTNHTYWPWFCGSGGGQRFLRDLLTGIVPVMIAAFWDTWVMPLALYILAQAERAHASFSIMDAVIARRFYIYDVLNSFIGSVIGGATLQQLGPALANGSVLKLIGNAVPSASNYFANYIIVHALLTNPFRFVWPHDGTVLFVFLRALGVACPHCPRDEWVIRSAPSYRAGRHYGSFMLVVLMGLTYCVVAPLLPAIALAFFLTAWVTWRYSAIHFYEHCYQGGGRLWALAFDLTIWTLWIGNLFTALVLLALRAYWLSGVLAATSSTLLYIFRRHVGSHLERFVEAAPLQAAAAGGLAASVPREAYLPPPLRRGAVGWFPEWGMVWEKYGLVRYSLW